MSWDRVWTIAYRDLVLVRGSKIVLLPMILLPVLLLVLIPAGVVLVPTMFGPNAIPAADIDALLRSAPEDLRRVLEGYTLEQVFVVFFASYVMAPLFLIVPLMVSSVIAADSFAGEKERKTLESLLYTPLSDREMLLGKALAAWLPATVLSIAGVAVYSVVIDLAAWPIMQELLLPSVTWVLLALWVGPAAAALGLCGTVLVSYRVRSFQEAYQISGLLVIPVVGLVVGQATGLMYFSSFLTFLAGLALWMLDGLLILYALHSFNRDQLAQQL